MLRLTVEMTLMSAKRKTDRGHPAGPSGKAESPAAAPCTQPPSSGQAESIATLRQRWNAAGPARQRMALDAIRRAQTRHDADDCLDDILLALKALRLSERRIVRLLVRQHLMRLAIGSPAPVREIACWLGAVFESFSFNRAPP